MLARLCSDLGSELLDVVLAPRGLDAPLREVTVHDALDPPGAGMAVGDVVLGVGVTGSDAADAELLRELGQLDVVALVCKRRGEMSSEVIAAAQDSGVALLTTDPDVPWSELYDLMRASLLAEAASTLPRGGGPMVGDLAALADATAAVAGGPVTIEDMSGRILAFSESGQDADSARTATILGRRVPDERMQELRQMGVVRRLLESGEVLPVEIADGEPRRAVAVRAGGHTMGAIWLIGSDEKLGPRADDALREAAQIAAMHLLRQRTFEDLEKRVRQGMLRMLLRGHGLPEVMLARLGFPPDQKIVVMAGAIGDGPVATDEHERFVRLITEHLRAYRWHAVATTLDARVYALVAVQDGRAPDALARTIADCLARARKALGVVLRAGMSDTVPGAQQLVAARRMADQSLDLGPPDGDVITYEQVEGQALLADVQAALAERKAPVPAVLQCLCEHDAERDTAYVQTLRAYLNSLGNAGLAAARMQIHVNTLRYRLRRITELIDVDLRDGDARLALELQLRLLPEHGR